MRTDGAIQNNLLLKFQEQLSWVQLGTGNLHYSGLDTGICHMLFFVAFKKVNIWLICLSLHNITVYVQERKKQLLQA